MIDAVLPGEQLLEADEAARLGAPEPLFRNSEHLTKATLRGWTRR